MNTSASTILRWPQLEQQQPLAGITASVTSGSRLSAAMFLMEPGAVVPDHSHDNEEFGQVVKGSLQLTWGSETTILEAGEAFLLPAGVPHGARAGADGCELLECYAPPRNPIPARQAGASS